MIWAGSVDRRAVVACRGEIDGLLGSGLAESAVGLLDGFDVPDGMTFVFDDGSPVEEINEFLRHAPIALSSVRKYAGDLAGLARWAAGRGLTVLSLSERDLLAYRRALTDPPVGGGCRRVSASRWNDLVAVFSTFYRWNVAGGKIVTSPIPRWPDGSGRAGLRLAMVEELRVRFLTAAEIRVFRAHGLGGDRERVFFDLVLCSGARRAEMARVCWVDLPVANSGRDYEVAWVLGKGAKARPVDVPRLVFGGLVGYRLGDREDVVVAHQRGYERRVRDGELVEYRLGAKPDRHGRAQLVRGGDRRATIGFGAADELARVVIRRDDGLLDPAALFLGARHGRMLSVRHWNAAFDAAERRCAGVVGAPARVTPHLLRHTFAVHLLAALVSAAASSGSSATLELIEHPLKTVQRALGHASPLTTYRFYIEAAQRCRGHVYRALDEMGRALWAETA
jgi:integrase